MKHPSEHLQTEDARLAAFVMDMQYFQYFLFSLFSPKLDGI